jgi:hypothetical protein
VKRILRESQRQKELSDMYVFRFLDDDDDKPSVVNHKTIYEDGFAKFKEKLKKAREKMPLSDRIKIVCSN